MAQGNGKGGISVRSVARNRANGKRYEGELVKVLRSKDINARLGRSNEEGDVILPELNIVIEAKSTDLDRYRISKAMDQFRRLRELDSEVWFAIRYKGNGILGWQFYPIPSKSTVLFRGEGLTLNEFVMLKEREADAV